MARAVETPAIRVVAMSAIRVAAMPAIRVAAMPVIPVVETLAIPVVVIPVVATPAIPVVETPAIPVVETPAIRVAATLAIPVVVTAVELAVVIRTANRATPVISREAILDGAIEAAAVAMTRAILQTPAISQNRSLGVAMPTMPMTLRAADVGGGRRASRLLQT